MGVAKVTFIPHSKNNHWPLALRHRTLAYTSSFLILAKIVAVSAIALTPNIAELSTITDSSMVQLTNKARTDAGLPPLTISSELTGAAKQKGQDMLKHQYFAHISPSGTTPWFWMKKTGYSYTVAGENLAIDFLDAEDVVTAWLNSPTHKANLLHKEYTQTGIAVVSGEFQGGTSVIVVHMFGKPLADEAQTPESTPEEEPSTPTTPPPQLSPPTPKTPRISLVHTPETNEDIVSFRAEGEINNSLVLLIENKERSITTIPDSGLAYISLPAKNLPAGNIAVQAFTRGVQGVTSDLSPPVSFINPKALPAVEVIYTFALSPAFDQQYIALVESSGAWQLFSLHSPIAVNAHVVSALPKFTMQADVAAKSFSASLVHATRQSTSIILISVICLLFLAIIIRIRTQHPALILHASLVIFLATTMLLTF
ncbi:MAG: CAP domain-containing protein [Patescibacteria group bacterium]